MSALFAKSISMACSVIASKGARMLHCGTGRLLFPVMWITNRCNLRCVMCDQWKTSEDEAQKELSAGQWCSFIDSLRKMRPAVLVITGGEPLLRPDTPDILRYAADNGINTHLCTNGTLLDERVIRRLRDARLGSVSVSLDSPDAATHNRIRGAVCYDRVIEHIRLLGSAAPSISLGINCVITRYNLFDIRRMVELAISLGAKQLRFDLIHRNLKHRHKDVRSLDAVRLGENDVPVLRGQVQRLADELSRTALLTNSCVYLDRIAGSAAGLSGTLRCYAGYVSCAIDPMGWVSACDHMPGAVNISEMPLERIWASRQLSVQRGQVRRCPQRCWDSFHAEMNIRMSMRYCLRTARQSLRESGYYLGRRRAR